jgi:hypothetical protein
MEQVEVELRCEHDYGSHFPYASQVLSINSIGRDQRHTPGVFGVQGYITLSLSLLSRTSGGLVLIQIHCIQARHRMPAKRWFDLVDVWG